MRNSRISQALYTPYTLAFNCHVQAFLSIAIEVILATLVKPVKYERELFKFKDGGTTALDWALYKGEGIPKASSKKAPILALFSGLTGGNDKLYIYSMIEAATKAGYKCVVVNYRGTADVPLATSDVYWLHSWRDVKEPLDYIYSKYCLEEGSRETRSLYAYGVSLGCNMVSLYLANEGAKCPLRGAGNFCAFYKLEENAHFFKNNAFSLYDKALGLNFYYNVVRPQFPQLRELIGGERCEELERKLYDNRFSMQDMHYMAMLPFVGFENSKEFDKVAELQGRLHDIKVPTFFLNSSDDIIYGDDMITRKEFEGCSENVLLATTKRGGHCGYL